MKRRINEGTLEYDWVMDELQRVIEGCEPESPAAVQAEQPKPVSPQMLITVNCDANPNIPSGLYLDGEGTEHRKMGQIALEKRADGKLYANGKEVVRHRSRKQQGGSYVQGHKLRKELKDVQVLNACIMDALLANPQLIPDEWKTGYTYFWGTIFRNADGRLFVKYLYWRDGGWDWNYHWLDGDWSGNDPAASLANLLVLPPHFDAGVSLPACRAQPPICLPISKSFSESAIYFFPSIAFIPQSTSRKNLARSRLRPAHSR